VSCCRRERSPLHDDDERLVCSPARERQGRPPARQRPRSAATAWRMARSLPKSFHISPGHGTSAPLKEAFIGCGRFRLSGFVYGTALAGLLSHSAIKPAAQPGSPLRAGFARNGVEERRDEVRRGRQPPLRVGNKGEPQSGDTIQANNPPNVALRTCPAMQHTPLRTSACRDGSPVARYTF
jgi:hypothetical protein